MADDNTGADSAQNESSGEQPYKSFNSEDDFKGFESKTFSNGYNEAKSKSLGKLGDALGSDFDDWDGALNTINDLQQKVSNQVSDPTATDEYKQLQNKYSELQNEYEQAQQKVNNVQQQYQVDQKVNEGLISIKESNKLNIPEGDVKTLFDNQHKVESVDGKLVAKQFDKEIGDYRAITDDNGNYKPVNQVFADFAKQYATPKAEGAGGESGAGAASSKPSFKAYRDAKQNGNYDKADEIFARMKEAGGWKNDEHSPVTLN